jgi:hypothetical protein
MKTFYIYNQESFDARVVPLVKEFFKKCPNKSFEIKLDSEWEKKTNAQLAYLHACIKELTQPMKDAGMIDVANPKFAKRYIKSKLEFFESSTMNWKGLPVTIIEFTSFGDYTKKQMSEAIEWVLKFGAELGIQLPDAESFKNNKKE